MALRARVSCDRTARSWLFRRHRAGTRAALKPSVRRHSASSTIWSILIRLKLRSSLLYHPVTGQSGFPRASGRTVSRSYSSTAMTITTPRPCFSRSTGSARAVSIISQKAFFASRADSWFLRRLQATQSWMMPGSWRSTSASRGERTGLWISWQRLYPRKAAVRRPSRYQCEAQSACRSAGLSLGSVAALSRFTSFSISL